MSGRVTSNKRNRQRELLERRERKSEQKRAAKIAKTLGLKPPEPAPGGTE
jgi:hypothetical protein